MELSIEIKQISAEETWPIRHKVMWPDRQFDYVKLEEDQNGLHFGLFKETKLVSIVSVFINDGDFQFRKLATLFSEQGKGFGTKLLERVFQEANAQNAYRICCNARADKTAFYKKFGMQETEERYEKGGIDFVIMEKLLP